MQVMLVRLMSKGEYLIVPKGTKFTGSGKSGLKALMPITFSSPRAQPEEVQFLISNESPYFSGCKSKILAHNSLQF